MQNVQDLKVWKYIHAFKVLPFKNVTRKYVPKTTYRLNHNFLTNICKFNF